MSTPMQSPRAERTPAPPGKAAGSGFSRIPPRRVWLTFAVILVANYFLMRLLLPGASEPITVPYTEFKEEAAKGNVKSIYSRGNSIEGRFSSAVTWPPPNRQPPPGERPTKQQPRSAETFTTELPAFVDPGLEGFLIAHKVEISAVPIQEGGLLSTLLFGFGPALILIAFYVWMYRRAAQGGGLGGALMGLGRSKARRYDQEAQTKVTFEDVAGIDEAENELVEVVDFLKDPQKYTRLGGSAPKGVLLVGAPGTGKTLLARAVAGEAGVPFFSMSAAEFVEM